MTTNVYLTLYPVFVDLALIFILGAFSFFFKTQLKRFIYLECLLTFHSVVCVINAIYYTYYASFGSVTELGSLGQVKTVKEAFYEHLNPLQFIYLIAPIVFYFIYKKLKKKLPDIKRGKKYLRQKFWKTVLVSLLIASISFVTASRSDYSRLYKQWNRPYVVNRFGLILYHTMDIVNYLSSHVTTIFGMDNALYETQEFFNNNTQYKESNKYTGMFEGHNVIFVHMESIQSFLMDLKFNGEYVLPTTRKLASEGMYFTNFYAEESVGTSSDSEFTYSSSLMPATSGTVAINYWDRDYPTIQKEFKKKGYYVFSMHGNNCSFWNRNLMHQSFGYDKFYCHTEAYDIDETIGLGLSDKSFFKQSVPYIKEVNDNNQNWYGLMIMLTNHTPFSYIGDYSNLDVTHKREVVDPITKEKKIETASYLEGTVLGNYFKSVHYADEALGQLLKDMDKEGLLDETVIVIYGDHDAKIKKTEYEYYYNYDFKTDTVLNKDDPNYHEITDYEYEINRKVPFIIWSKNNNRKVKYDKIGGMIDVMPTLGNMFGFQNEYSLGHDLFSTNDNIVVFPDGNWVTDKMYYNSQKEEALLLDSKSPISVDYIEKNNKIAEQRISVSNAIITYDMIKNQKEQQELIKKGG